LRLFHNLDNRHGLPLALLSQYLPAEYVQVREGRLENQPAALVRAHIQRVLQDYAAACS
jgi:D-tagatose-1,6-bisphosphate aldolase subunit GatZ/KbaZ